MQNFSSRIHHDNDESNQQRNSLESPLNLTKSQSIWSPARSLENEANNFTLKQQQQHLVMFQPHNPNQNFTFGKARKEPKEETKIFPVSSLETFTPLNSSLIQCEKQM